METTRSLLLKRAGKISKILNMWSKGLFSIVVLIFLFTSSAAEAGKKVVATFLPVWIFTKNVAGDRAEVSLLVPPGMDIHEFSLKPADLKFLDEADLIVLNGAGLETHILKRIDTTKVIDTSKGIRLIKSGYAVDPHVWLDPLQAMIQVKNIRDALSALDPENKSYYEANAESYIRRLKSLDMEIMQGIQRLKSRYLITYHEAFGYFARRYGLRYYSLTGLQAENPLPGKMRVVYDIVREKGIKAVFSERQFPERSLERLRRDLGVNVCRLDTIETGSPEVDYYEKVMRENLNTIVRCMEAE